MFLRSSPSLREFAMHMFTVEPLCFDPARRHWRAWGEDHDQHNGSKWGYQLLLMVFADGTATMILLHKPQLWVNFWCHHSMRALKRMSQKNRPMSHNVSSIACNTTTPPQTSLPFLTSLCIAILCTAILHESIGHRAR